MLLTLTMVKTNENQLNILKFRQLGNFLAHQFFIPIIIT